MGHEEHLQLLGAVIKSAMVDYAGLERKREMPGISYGDQMASAESFIDDMPQILEGMHVPNALKWGKYIQRKAKEMKDNGLDQEVMTLYPRKVKW